MVFTFPQKAPKGALTVDDVGTIEQLELAKLYNQHWACHTVSLTAYYEPSNYFEVCQWVYDNFDYCIGLSFLPRDNGSYKQAPYTKISKAEYEEMGQAAAGHRLGQAHRSLSLRTGLRGHMSWHASATSVRSRERQTLVGLAEATPCIR